MVLNLLPLTNLGGRPYNYLTRRKRTTCRPKVAGRALVPWQIRLLDDEQVDIAIRAMLVPCARTEQDDIQWVTHCYDQPYYLLQESIGDFRYGSSASHERYPTPR